MKLYREILKSPSRTIIICCFVLFICNVYCGWCQFAEDMSPLAQIDAYKKQLAKDTTRVDVRLQLAKVFLQIEAYSHAVTEYREVLSVVNTTHSNSGLAEGYYGLGLAYAGLEKFDDAIEAYQQAIAYAPKWAHIHAALGASYANLHRYDAALNAYKTAHDLQPNDAMIHHQLGNIYSKQGKRAEAITHQQKAIVLSPRLASAHYQLGLLYTQENQLTEAISAYETAYTEDPELIEALYNLAQTHLRNGNRQVAREKMQLYERHKAEIQPIHKLRGALQRTRDQSERANILANIGRLYIKGEHFKKAVREYEKAIALNPKGAAAYNGIGIAYTMLKRYAEAIEAQNKALELQPDFVEAYAGLGLIYFKENKDDLALNKYRQAIALSRNRGEDRKPQFEVEAHLKIGAILLNQKDYSAAASTYQTVLGINPNITEAYHNLGVCYAHQGQTAEALETLELAVKVEEKRQDNVNSDDVQSQSLFLPETHYLIGELYAKQKKYNAAESAYLTSGLPKAYHALAQLIATMANTDKNQSTREEKLRIAVSYAKTAITMDPNIASYHNTLALIKYRKGDFVTAEKSIRKAIKLDPKNPNYKEGLKQILKRQ